VFLLVAVVVMVIAVVAAVTELITIIILCNIHKMYTHFINLYINK
jgi:hypothetical protein